MRNVSTLTRPTMLSAALFILVICLVGISAANVQAATITVTGTGDAIAVDGQCTLREAITAANTDAPLNECPAGNGADTVNFDTAGVFAVPQTITLDGTELTISTDLMISGTGAANLTISGNNASRVFFIGGNVTLDGLTITGGNTVGSFGNHGGAIEHVSGTLTVTNSIVSGNSAELSGGGIHSQFSVLSIINSTVSGNTASSLGGGGGGGVIVLEGTLTVMTSTVSGNYADTGGGIYNNVSTLTVQRSTISGNSSGNGGGIYASTGTTNLTNTTISGNSGNSGLGGGIYYDGGTSTVTNSTIVGNGSTYAGSVYNPGGEVHLDSTIVANGDSPAGCPGIVGEITANYSLIQDVVCGNLSGGNNLIGVLPMVGPLQFNGGPTKTHALLPGSPAINAVSNPNALTTDQRGTGFARVGGGAADIGAFEVQPACAGISFGSANNFTVGNLPHAVGTGDFNGDGRSDLAVGFSGAISVRIGDGDGTFGPAVNYATNTAPLSLMTGDFNGDGNTDLVVANPGFDNVKVLIGNGNGTFAPAVTFATGDGPWSVTTGDFNGDGKTDIATANAFSNDISVLIGNGDGTFAPHVSYPSGSGPISITSGDFDGDGTTDLATANSISDTISVFRGNGDGTFVLAVTYPSENGPWSITTGDFNGDGNPDLAVANQFSDEISVRIGNGDGTFAPAVNFAGGDGPYTLTTADFDGDGITDLATTTPFSSQNISVFRGNGDGTFAAAVNVAAGNRPEAMATGDFNGDGKPDLAAANFSGGNVSVLLNSCSSNTAPVVFATPSTQNVQYSDVIADVTITATDPESDESDLTIEYSFTKDAGGSTDGLPSGLSSTDNGVVSAERRWKVSGTADVEAGTYVVTVTVSDDADPALTATASFTIVVAREDATVTASASNAVSVKVNIPGGTAGPITLCADIGDAADGSPGNIALAVPVTFVMTPVAPGGTLQQQDAALSSGRACVTFSNVPVNVYDVTITVGGNYYTGSGSTVLAVYDPSLGFTTGGGRVFNPATGNTLHFGFNFKYDKKGFKGQMLVIEHLPNGSVVKLKSNSLSSLSIVGSQAIVLGKASVSNGAGNLSFRLNVTDNGEPGTSDKFGLKLTSGVTPIPAFTIDPPQTIIGGNIQVPKK